MRVLITRPTNLGIGLAEKIKAIGDVPELFPVIEIKKTSHQAKLQSAIDVLNTKNIAIFISQSAVQFGMPAIKSRWPKLPDILWAAVGPGTAQILKKQVNSTVLVPDAPPYESETLLTLPEFQSVHGKQIVIFRGNGGRELLSQTLNARGATVQAIEVYQRYLPTFDQNMLERIKDWHHTPINVIVTTSADSLHNLVLLVENLVDDLREIPIVVVGSRMCKLAKELKFKRPLIATGADDASIINVLKAFKENRL